MNLRTFLMILVKKRLLPVLALLVLFGANTVGTVNAQDPQLYEQFTLSPYSSWGLPGSDSRVVPQIIVSNQQATTDLMIRQADNMRSITIAFDYNSDVVQVARVRPGTLFNGLTQGTNFDIRVTRNVTVPRNNTEPVIGAWDARPVEQPPTVDMRTYADIFFLNPMDELIFRSGSLISIDWNIQNIASDNTTPIFFTMLAPTDIGGRLIRPCVGDVGVPNGGNFDCFFVNNNPFFWFLAPTFAAPPPPPPLPFNAGPIIGRLTVAPFANPNANQLQIRLQGLSPELNPLSPPKPTRINGVTVIITQNGATVGPVGGPDSQGRVDIPVPPPYDSIIVRRAGYLEARGTNINSISEVVLLAGDVNNTKTIDIADITFVANRLGIDRANNPQIVNLIDFNGNGVIDIGDLAIVASNFPTYAPSVIPFDSPGLAQN